MHTYIYQITTIMNDNDDDNDNCINRLVNSKERVRHHGHFIKLRKRYPY